MKPSFDTEYAEYLGYHDAREYGSKHPQRSFDPMSSDRRDNAYFQGIRKGLAVNKRHGLAVESCRAKWDNVRTQGFEADECGQPAYGMARSDRFNRTFVMPVCKRHAIDALALHEPGEGPHWSVVPMNWL